MPTTERSSAHIGSVVPPTMKADFQQWCADRHLTVSQGVQSLIRAALHADPKWSRRRAYRPLQEGVTEASRVSPDVGVRA
jgi:hypothetical protein